WSCAWSDGRRGNRLHATSVRARHGEPDDPMYAASKHAARALTESLRLALQGKNIRMTAIMPGAVATNLVRTMPQEQLFAIGRMFGIDPEAVGIQPGEHLPQEVFERVLGVARQFVMSPEDIAQAVVYAVTTPETVHINEIMVRPPQQLQIPGVSAPA